MKVKTLTGLSDVCNYLNKHFTFIANKVLTFPSTDYKSETLGSFVKNKVPSPVYPKVKCIVFS